MPKINVTAYTTPVRHRKMNTKPHKILIALASASRLTSLLLLLLASACSTGASNESDNPPPTRDPTTTTEPTTTTLSTENMVRADYEAFVAMIDRITTTTVDPNDPELPARMIDPALSEARTLLSTWQAQGQIWLAGDENRHQIETVVVNQDGITAAVTDCVVANDVLISAGSTDTQLPPPRTERVKTTMVNQDGTWRAQDSELIRRWEGVAGCAA